MSLVNDHFYGKHDAAGLTEITDQIQQSKGRLDEECRATIDEANTVLDDRLSNSITQRIQAIKKMQSVTQKISQPCGNEKIEWQVADGNQFGTTTLDTIMRSLSKEVIAAERKIAKYRTEHADIDGALQDEAALNSVQRQGIDISTMNLPAPKQDHQDMMKLQVEKEKIKSLIERENDKAANALQDIDMVCLRLNREFLFIAEVFLEVLQQMRRYC